MTRLSAPSTLLSTTSTRRRAGAAGGVPDGCRLPAFPGAAVSGSHTAKVSISSSGSCQRIASYVASKTASVFSAALI